MSQLDQQLEKDHAYSSSVEAMVWWQRIRQILDTRHKMLVIYWIYGVLITVAEVVVAYQNVKLGIFLHILLLGALLVHSAFTFRAGTPWLYLALTLAPLTRLMSLSMPLADIPPIFWYVAISMPLFAAAVGVVRVAGFKFSEIGFNLNNLPVQLPIIFLGLLLGVVEYTILRPQPMISSLSLEQLWFPALVLIICTGLLEEFIFRGVMYRAAFEAVGEKFALYYVSFIFAVLHITHLSLWDIAFVFAVAVLFTKIFVWQKSILGLTLAHGLTNITLYLLCPLVF